MIAAALHNETEHWFCDAVTALLPELYGTARRLTGNAADAEDLVADAVSSAWAKRDALRDRTSFRAWLFRIMHNAHISQRRASRAHGASEALPAEDGDADEPGFSLFERLHQPLLLWWGNPEQDFLHKLLREDVERALDALPEPYRLVVVLCDVEGWQYREIAAALAVPIGTVKSRLARGRSLLQQTLWQHARDIGLRASGPSDGVTSS